MKKNKIINLLIHLIVWSVVLLAPLYIKPKAHDFTIDNEVYLFVYYLLSISTIIFYYITQYYLIPKLFFKQKYWSFVFLQLSIIIAFGVGTLYLTHIYSPDLRHEFGRGDILKKYFFRYFVVIFFSFLLSYRQKFKQIKAEKLKAELEALKSQINPHFLFNTLNDIYGQAIIKSDQTANSISKLSSMMRYVLTETKAEKVDLQREVDYLKTYVELQKIRLTEQTKINFSVQGDTFQKQISPLLFINFVENAFKYGVSNEYETHIDISIHIENQSLELRVKNDIVNRFNDLNSNNMGLDNIKLRLDLLYPNKYKLDIENDGEKFIVSLKIKNI